MRQLSPPQTDNVFLAELPSGQQGTLATLKIMKAVIKKAKRDFRFRKLALDIVTNVNGKNWLGEAAAIQKWVRDNIRYVKDIRGIETIATPENTLEWRQGDCDDHAILVSTLLESIGHPTRLMAVGFRPGKFVHVYVETKIGSRWIPVETTEKWPLGYQIKGLRARMVIYV